MRERQLDQYNSFSISAVNNFQQGQHSEEHVKKVEVYGQRQMISLPSLKCATSLRKMNPWNLIRTNILEHKSCWKYQESSSIYVYRKKSSN